MGKRSVGCGVPGLVRQTGTVIGVVNIAEVGILWIQGCNGEEWEIDSEREYETHEIERQREWGTGRGREWG